MHKSGWWLVKLIAILSLSIIVIVLSSCSQKPANTANTTQAGSKTPPSGNSSGRGSISAKIDGVQWNSVITSAGYTNVGLVISGADNSNPTRSFGLGIAAISTGTFQITPQNPVGNATWTVGSATWQMNVSGGDGTITITSLTSTGASGTFSFTMVPLPNTSATGTKTITDGVFNVTFSSPATIPAEASTTAAAITAQVNGATWKGITVQATYQNQSLSITGFDPQVGQITLNIYKVTGPGTYSLAYLNSDGSSAIYADSTGQGSNTFLPGGTGSVTITTLTSTEAAGTFSFDASSAGGSGGTTHVTSGYFDVSLK